MAIIMQSASTTHRTDRAYEQRNWLGGKRRWAEQSTGEAYQSSVWGWCRYHRVTGERSAACL